MAEEEGKLLCLRWELKGAAISEFEVARSADERRGWRAGAASGEGQQADLWPIPILVLFKIVVVHKRAGTTAVPI